MLLTDITTVSGGVSIREIVSVFDVHRGEPRLEEFGKAAAEYAGSGHAE
jgi:hypothetical protein